MTVGRALTKEEVQLCLDQLKGMGYAEDDIQALLNRTGQQMIGYIIDTIGNQYRRTYTNRHEVPSSLLWELIPPKAYDHFIPIAEDWLKRLRLQRKQMNKANDS